MDNLRKELGLDENTPIPPDYNIPYFVHQDDMNKMDMSHRRVEKWLFTLCLVIFLALVATNIFWIHYENSFQDVVVTDNMQDGTGTNIMSGGDVTYGTEK